jgi:hypothetical protein
MNEGQREELRRRFPNLMKEVDGRRSSVRIGAVRTETKEAEKASYSVQVYEPTAVDFIRRCDTDEQALEIINFLEVKGDIDPDYAKRLREQLVRQGLRSFGKKKGPGCYEQG